MDRGHARTLLDQVLGGVTAGEDPLTHVATLPARDGEHADWPAWVPGALVERLRGFGIDRPWAHQVAAADLARAGQDVVIATGTASGKSLAYQLPVLAGLSDDPRATALYLSPTKALGADQLRAALELSERDVRPAAYDGDTPQEDREWVRSHSRWVFTNPDMLHLGVLPRHQRWARFFRRLSFVVLDECHTYRGLFGSHVAVILRRLSRIAARYGASPVFVLASATTADPQGSATLLTGRECVAVARDTAPRGERVVALWEPPLSSDGEVEGAAPSRRSAGAEAARILTDLVVAGARTLVFVRSRVGAELASLHARDALGQVDAGLPARVASYRAGYLPEERRELERALASGELLGLATTSALELGIDIAGLDAVVVAGYPGTRASFWQQAGRAGRAGQSSLVVFVARDDPMDTYLVHHPEALLGAPVESTVLDPANPHVLAPQLACAAAELPLTPGCLPALAGGQAETVLAGLVEAGVVRRRPTGWYWTHRDRPHGQVDIRGSGGEQVVVVEGDTGRLLGTVAPEAACSSVHPGAVYLHQGESFVVDELDLAEHLALVHRETPDWSTFPRTVTDVVVVGEERRLEYPGGLTVGFGEVEVISQVVGYLRRAPSGAVLDQVPLDLPSRTLRTRAVWYSLSDELVRGVAPGGAGLDPARVPGALHAAEHAAIGLLPLFATCDRWDIGGVSTVVHEHTGEATVFVHDGHPGGAGFAERGFSALMPWLAATREAITSCECSAGCPSCVQSPKCGNGNEPLDKAGAVVVLDLVLSCLRRSGTPLVAPLGSADEGG
ncbi:DEAD/DEAH box helicase [Actinoalloteichus caeruleus]|uniref:DEAD/DEAH box helicase domain-containing protein n=1 Tax=Actinoalloteichus caeruleus DSM 43889 TaxID=1120930 RepID=A0ABT1JJM9_ACTCY|nr:DEAD/DEAH box helicase [Actinoalloteichus caeruleus]MCP2332705.1 DEAD/DEAH box helicase domain-containing protein [Actinoalloteichus caeruleus DSM 43889]